MDAAELLYGIGAAQLSEATGTHRDTARRWKRSRRLPRAIARLLALVVHGQLGEISRAWSGWNLRRDKLISPEGLELSPGDLRAIPVRIAQVRGLERDLEGALGAIEADAELSARVRAYASLGLQLSRALAALEQLAASLPPALQDRLFQLQRQPPPRACAQSCACTSDVPSVTSSRAPGRAR